MEGAQPNLETATQLQLSSLCVLWQRYQTRTVLWTRCAEQQTDCGSRHPSNILVYMYCNSILSQQHCPALPCPDICCLAVLCRAVCHAGMGMERALFIRERNDGLYRPVTYLLYKLLDELLLMLPVTSATTATVFLACRLQGSFLLFWLVNYVTLANGTGGAHALVFGQAIQSTNRRGC